MPYRSCHRIVLGAAALLAIAAAPARADTCTAAKLMAVGRKEAGLLGCYSRATARGDTAGVATCVATVQGKYGVAFAKAGACSGDAVACEAIAEACATVIRHDLSDAGASRCEARRLRLAGKSALRKLICNAKAAAKGLSVDAACVQKVEAKFQAAFRRTSGCTGDETTVQNAIDRNCVEAVRADAKGGGSVGVLCDRVCCQSQNFCVGGSGSTECTGANGTPAPGGQACDSSQQCVAAPTATPGGCCEEGNGSGRCLPESESSASSCASAGGLWQASAVCTESGACEHRATSTTTTTLPCGYTDELHLVCGGACPAGATCVGQVTIAIPPLATCLCASASQCTAGSCRMFPIDCAGGDCDSRCSDGEHGCPAGYGCVDDTFVCEGPSCSADCSCPAAAPCRLSSRSHHRPGESGDVPGRPDVAAA
jgi:hypothetical protein